MKKFVVGLLALSLAACGGESSNEPEKEVDPDNGGGQTNNIPVAALSGPLSVVLGGTIELDGSSSNDPDGDSLTFVWSFSSQPEGSLLPNTLLGDNAKVAFKPEVLGDYTVQLIVNDGVADSSPALISFSVTAPDPDGSGPGKDGTDPGDGGTDPGDGGTDPGDGGTDPGDGGTDPGDGGTDPGDGGTDPGDGGTDPSPTPNNPPVAVVPSSIEVALGEQATIDGSQSFDVDGDRLTYFWTLLQTPEGSANTSSDFEYSSSGVSFIPDQAGTYRVQLVVSDGFIDSSPVIIEVEVAAGNEAPVANAGYEVTVEVNNSIEFDGSRSYDNDGDIAEYKWSLVSGPYGSALVSPQYTLVTSESKVQGPTFDVVGTYVFELVVNDGELDSEASELTVTVKPPNTPPTVSIKVPGYGQDYYMGGEAVFYSDVYDKDGDDITYSWSFSYVPTGSNLANKVSEKSYFAFHPDKAGFYTASLFVSDGRDSTEAVEVNLEVKAAPKIALKAVVQSGSNRLRARVGEELILDFSQSVSPEGRPLEYEYKMVRSSSMNLDATITSSQSEKAIAKFLANESGFTIVTARVFDGENYSDYLNFYIDVYAGHEKVPTYISSDKQQHVMLGDEVVLSGAEAINASDSLIDYYWSRKGTVLETEDHGLLDIYYYSTLIRYNAELIENPTLPGRYEYSVEVDDYYKYGQVQEVTLFVYDTAPVVAKTAGKVNTTIGAEVALDGSASLGMAEDVSAKWYLISAPDDSTSAITDESEITASFGVDVEGYYVFQLNLSKGDEVVSVEQLSVVASTNGKPTAVIAPVDSSVVNNVILLDGTASSDPDGDSLTYDWKIVGTSYQYGLNLVSQVGSFDDASSATPTLTLKDTFTADQVVIGLTVSDGTDSSERSTIVINR
ncbi:PKD domain-containing protein [Paraferrimonas sedimenticola]|uniref:PKD/Chitinase domain-containing protein n=1 Tax=Paraferrimonas sedimenticola TaxID=375674 RepID=A0AA37W172_9GAMM|nr:PKD domain-containing protein [Paraferrimonas sedimenticola]GLP97045.1 hypothetical protein GCM10007895_23510 [Paraferrimonas sedimenticola]